MTIEVNGKIRLSNGSTRNRTFKYGLIRCNVCVCVGIGRMRYAEALNPFPELKSIPILLYKFY